MANTARNCSAVQSHWIALVILMCDDTLSVLFKNGVCVNYPRSTAAMYRSMLAAPSKGRWLWQHLYRLLPYRRIALPCPAAGCGVTTACCPGMTIPATVHLTVTGGSSLDGSYPAVYDAASQWWTTTIGGCTVHVQCDALVGNFEMTGVFGTPSQPSDPGGTCAPLHFVFTNAMAPASVCSGIPGDPPATITLTL